jgi:hypothetical protein
MRKSFLILSLLLLIAFSSHAWAASPVEFRGYMKVYHESLSNFVRGYERPYDEESFFHNKLQVLLTFHPSDNAKVVWQLRGVSLQRWGTTDLHSFTRGLYGELDFDFGTIRLGRILDGMPGNVAGLASLGYFPIYGREYIYIFPFDYDNPVDGITYQKNWDLEAGNKFGILLFYYKQTSNIDATSRGVVTGNYPLLFPYTPDPLAQDSLNPKDVDYDVFGFETTYKWETGGVSFGMEYDRNMSDPSVKKDWALYFNPAFYQVLGKITLHFEGKLGIGERTYDKNLVDPDRWKKFEDEYLGHPWDGTLKNKGLGLYLDAVYDYGSGNLTLASWYVSGTDINDRGHLNSLVDLGDFSPFLVAYNGQAKGIGVYKDVLGERWLARNVPSDFNYAKINSGIRNQWGIGIIGVHHLVPDKIKMNYGVGYFRLNKPAMLWVEDDTGFHAAPYLVNGSTESFRYQSKDLGYELDLGFTFQILTNVWLETQFGYFFNGKAFDFYDISSASFKSAKDTFYWANMLAIHF